MSRPSDLLAALSRAYNLTETHGLDDPEVRDALLDVRDAAVGGSPVEVEIFGNGLGVVGASPEEGRTPGVLAQDLAALGVSRMTIPADVDPAHLERFLGSLRDAVEGTGITLEYGAASGGAGGERSVASLHGAAGEMQAGGAGAAEADTGRDRDVMDLVVSLAAEEEAASAGGVASGDQDAMDVEAEWATEAAPEEEIPEEEIPEEEEASGEEASGEDIVGAEVPEEAPDAVAERIEELLAAYRGASPAEEGEALDALRDEAERLRAEGSVDAVAHLVEEVILAAEEGEIPEDAVAVVREFASHGVMARIAMHLGVSRQEDRRHALTRVACRLGGSMASAIADALTDAPDRSARRTYMEAMEAMGDDAREIAENMAADSRWFIARNGVALLGHLGDRDAIQHLTTPLAHSDPRLRKETLVTLAKLGGEDAGNLAVGMLGDADPDVRASAAMAVGVLRVGKAQRQLLGRLDKEEKPDVQVAILKALGQLGDPGSVPAIEKRAVGGLFSRAPTDVRIAAYRALSGIGTPHARSLLEQAAQDKDLEIRTVVRSLIERREKTEQDAEPEPEVEGDTDLEGLDGSEDRLELE